MSNAAARIDDPHVCPKIETGVAEKKSCSEVAPPQTPHTGGVVSAGATKTFVEGKRAARCGDAITCTGVKGADLIVTGPAAVFIEGKLAARDQSFGAHDEAGVHGTVTATAKKTFYGGAMGGATFGDPADATAACMEAANKGRHGSQQQNKAMNCGVESVRQTCIQACKNGNKKACACAEKSEDDFYKQYLQQQAGKNSTHNQIANKGESYEQKQKEYDEAKKYNDEHWAANAHHTYYNRKDGASKRWTVAGANWIPSQGYTVYYYDDSLMPTSYDSWTVKTVPSPPMSDIKDGAADDPKVIEKGDIGSYTPTRKELLDACGVASTAGDNSDAGMAADVAGGHGVLAVVDIGSMYPTQGATGHVAAGAHTVTVTQMVYDKDGSLKEVTLNDTSQTDGCGKKVPGDQFKAGLIPGQPTNVI